jgi:peptidoglycan/LPS O-acetylase OafA/YrhL
MENKHRRNDEIEVLRAVAILFTLFHHAPYYLFALPNSFFNSVFTYSTFWSGVDLFLVISGFVIMKSFMRLESLQLSKGRTLKVFWIKRIFRIWPSAWLWIGIYLALTLGFNQSGAFGEIQQNFKDSIAAFFQYANIYGLQCWGPGQVMNCGPNGIYWSLSLEEQFYILLPLVIFIFRKKLSWFLFAGICVQFFFYRPVWTLGWAIRTDALMWGVLLAILFGQDIYQRLEPKILLKQPVLKFLVFPILFFAMATLPAPYWGIHFSLGLLAIVCLILVFVASFNAGYLMRKSLARDLLVWIGGRSYSLYLIHIVASRFAWELVVSILGEPLRPESSWLAAAIAYPLLFALAELNYRYLETPLRKYGQKLARPA